MPEGTASGSPTSTDGPERAGFPEFDACYQRLTQRHAEIDGVQVTNRAMESLVLETGIATEKVHRIPIGIDPVAFPLRTEEVKARARRELGLPDTAFVVGSFQKDGVGLGRRTGAQAHQGPGRPRRGSGAPPRARTRPLVLLTGRRGAT